MLKIFKKREKLKLNLNFIVENEFRIKKKDGEIKWVREIIQNISDESESSGKFQGLVYDITERKMAEETLEKIDKIRLKEVHHRIKNNLQVISSLLSLQAEKFEDNEHKHFGQDGFETMVARVANLEKELGIYDLNQFTPLQITTS